jgi:hypothetical protein
MVHRVRDCTAGLETHPLPLQTHPTAEARKRTGLPCNFSVLFYAGKYFTSFGSIFPVEDVISVVPPGQVRACWD